MTDVNSNDALLDTIVARATGAGTGALAVVRLSGPRAHSIADTLIRDGHPPGAGRVGVRWLCLPDHSEALDQVLMTTFAAPHSYTGEDVIEFSCHGGPLTSQRIVDACEQLGARRAEPGEFTRRAYLNGRMDLIQAEAVADLIEGDSEALHRTALHQLDRGLSRRLAELREAIVGLEASLVHHIDFPDEDEPPVPLDRIVAEARDLVERLDALRATAPEGELLRDGAVTVLAGAPNSGKSSLFNALIGQERAIVTEIAGTTRDALEAKVSLGGFPFLLVDTAGLRDSDDQVERIGIEVAERYLNRADVILFCVEHGAPASPTPAVLESSPATVVRVTTKVDLAEEVSATRNGEVDGFEEEGYRVEVSAHSGHGLDQLRALLPRLAFAGLVRVGSEAPVLTRERQRRGIETALSETRAFADALEGGVPAEVASAHLRPAATALEELLGVIPNDEVLDRVFREFCIGK